MKFRYSIGGHHATKNYNVNFSFLFFPQRWTQEVLQSRYCKRQNANELQLDFNLWALHSMLEFCSKDKTNTDTPKSKHLSDTVRSIHPTTIWRIIYSSHVGGPRSNKKMPNPLSLMGWKTASQEFLKSGMEPSARLLLQLMHLCQLRHLPQE